MLVTSRISAQGKQSLHTWIDFEITVSRGMLVNFLFNH